MDASKKKLDFEKPPVDEVVLSVVFRTLNGLLAPHLGEIWQEFKQDGFVHLVEQPPIPSAVEQFPNPIQEAQLHISNVPDLARIWFISADDSEIIQVQRDRFTFNWRKSEEQQQYPGFSSIFERFEEFYNRFGLIIKDLQIGSVNPLQYELTYIDQLFRGDGWDTLDDIEQVYTMLVDSQKPDSFWDGADYVSWRTSFPIVDLYGRLHLSISNRIKMPEQRQTLQTDFTVRGFSENPEFPMPVWFKSARDRIREKFVSIFRENIQTKIWERR